MNKKLSADDLQKIKDNLALLDQNTYDLGELSLMYEQRKSELIDSIQKAKQEQSSLKKEIKEKYQVTEEFTVDLETGEIS